MNLDVKFSGNFLRKINERIEKWKGDKEIAARITADPEAEWWYYQEFGTASQGEKGGAPYKITPSEADALAFQGDQGLVITGSVTHPGVKPTRMVRKVIPDIQDEVKQAVRQALREGGSSDPVHLHQAVLEATHEAKAKIVDSVGKSLKTSEVNSEFPRQSGKLGGRSPEEVFDQHTHVVDLSE